MAERRKLEIYNRPIEQPSSPVIVKILRGCVDSATTLMERPKLSSIASLVPLSRPLLWQTVEPLPLSCQKNSTIATNTSYPDSTDPLFGIYSSKGSEEFALLPWEKFGLLSLSSVMNAVGMAVT